MPSVPMTIAVVVKRAWPGAHLISPLQCKRHKSQRMIVDITQEPPHRE
jgi:hypothetical protein